MELPERTTDAEDAFVRRWGASDDTDGLIAVTEAAMAARRPMLAARLVGLLEDHVEIEPGSALDRARRERYAGWSSDLGSTIIDGSVSLADLEARDTAGEIDPSPTSGRKEALENLVNQAIWTA